MRFWAFLSDAPRDHPEGHQEGGVGTDRFPHGRAVASFGLTSPGTQPRMGAGAPGPWYMCLFIQSSWAQARE